MAPAMIGTRHLVKMRLGDIEPVHLLEFLSRKLLPRGAKQTPGAGFLSPKSVVLLHGLLSSIFAEAVEDRVLTINPAKGVRRRLGLSARVRDEQDEVHALTREQHERLLESVGAAGSAWLARFLLLASKTGLRIGELLALRWVHVDEVGQELHVRQTLATAGAQRRTVEDRLGSPKSGRARRVELGGEAVRQLTTWRTLDKAAALQAGRTFAPTTWILSADGVTPLDQAAVREGFKRCLRRAGLPEHFSPHTLRHTYAVRLIEQGAPLPYVQKQLGHASITMTCDTYGRWIPTGNREWMDRLDTVTRVPQALEARLAVGETRPAGAIIPVPFPVPPPRRDVVEGHDLPLSGAIPQGGTTDESVTYI